MSNTLKKGLSLKDASMIIMGSMIGSGIFIVPAAIARDVGSPFLFLLVWLITAIITIAGALSYGELAAMYPKAGGQYVYLREIFHPSVGFLYGWTLFTVIQTGTIAAVAVAFAKFLGVFWQSVSPEIILLDFGLFSLSSQQLVALLIIVFFTSFNFLPVKDSALLQNFLTTIKIASLLGFLVVVFMFADYEKASAHFQPFFPTDFSFIKLGVFITAMVGALFSADAWNNITFTAGEVENPKKNIPLSLIIGTGIVLFVYFLMNISYLTALDLDAIKNAPQDRVSTKVLQVVIGDIGMYIMAGMILISTAGCLNGIILTGARVYYAMALDGLFIPKAKLLNKNGVPAVALMLQAIWAGVLTLSGSYGDLLDYVIFAVLLFYIITIIGVMVSRVKHPDKERPYKTLFYPLTPIIYIVFAGAVCVTLLLLKPNYTFPGLGLVLLGLPVYYFIAKKRI